jgi:DedD protein
VNSGFINRLVGTSIVVIAAIVFIPNILDGEKTHYKEGFKAIPARSEFKTIDLQESIDLKVADTAPLKQDRIEEDEPADDRLTLGTDAGESQFANEAPIIEAQITPDQGHAIVQSNNTASVVKTPEKTITASALPDVEKVIPAEIKKTSIAKIEPRKTDDNLSNMAYVIQLGSFSHAANVKALQAKLQAKGFTTFTKPIKTPNGTLTKVFVGPSLDKEALDAKLPELKALTKLNGRITRFEVTP